MKLEPRHLAMWAKADPITKPGPGEDKPPTYGAWHRQRAERVVEREGDETPKSLEERVSDGE